MKTLNDYMAMNYRMEIVEDNDEGVDVKDPVQRAASVESVSPSEFKAVAAAKGDESSKGGDR